MGRRSSAGDRGEGDRAGGQKGVVKTVELATYIVSKGKPLAVLAK